ncbi:MAG TPA: FecR domain-containing protein [Bryobacteraceae bacterium]
MNDDYLWDRSGPPDEEIQDLEELLGQFRRRPLAAKRKLVFRWPLAAAAMLAIALAAGWLFQSVHSTDLRTGWSLTINGSKAAPLHAGQVIETDANTQAMVEAGEIGEVQIDRQSRFRLEKAGKNEQRFLLDHGTIHALIWAPPTQFVVDTPAAKTVDLGCRYTLSVSADGSGELTVEMGWVAFEWRGIESFIPEGARCITHAGRGPGTPYFLDAPKALTDALERFDRDGDRAALETAITTARKHDALTLWHLLKRTEGTERAEVFDRFASLVSLPPVANREAILQGNQPAFDAAWDALNLGDTAWWREWKRPWPR